MNVNSVASGVNLSAGMLESGSLLDQVQTLGESADQVQTPETLQKIARDFESVFMSLILKELRESLDMSEDGSGGLFPSDKSGSLGGIFDMFLSQHLAESSSLGVADMIQQYLANQSNMAAPEGPEALASQTGLELDAAQGGPLYRVDLQR